MVTLHLQGIIMKDKSIYNKCPICNLPRGKGPYEFSHGKCMEQRAKTDGKKLAFPESKEFKRITVENVENASRRRTAKKYLNGTYPKWMFE